MASLFVCWRSISKLRLVGVGTKRQDRLMIWRWILSGPKCDLGNLKHLSGFISCDEAESTSQKIMLLHMAEIWDQFALTYEGNKV
jgi:hypothetical protein